MKTKTYFCFRVDIWDSAANNIVEHIAGIDDFEVAVTTYWAAVARWPAARITLRQGARVVMKTWTEYAPPGPQSLLLRRKCDSSAPPSRMRRQQRLL